MNFVTKTLEWQPPTTVTYKSDAIAMQVGDDEVTLTFAELAARPDWTDFTVYGVRFNPVVDPGRSIKPGVVNIYAQTAVGKRTTGELARDMGTSLLIHVFVPHAGVKSFDECDVLFCVTQDMTSNVELTEIVNGSGKWVAQRTGLKLDAPTTISPDGAATINVQLTDAAGAPMKASVTVRLTADAGYLPRRSVQLDENGKGAFKIRADLLETGDAITVKAGYRYFTGLAKTTLEVK